MIVSTSKLFKFAYKKYAIGAYSVNSMEVILGLFNGAKSSKAPLLIQISSKAHRYAGKGVLESIIHTVSKEYPEVIFGVHLDHGTEEDARWCIESGFYSSVMIDASMKSYKENIEITKRVVFAAHQKEIMVEAELGRLSGKEDDIDVDDSESFLTDPIHAAEFVKQTGVDSLAVAVGLSHGMHKFKDSKGINLERLEQIQKELPGFPLVLHGASNISLDEIRRINLSGGDLDTSSNGVPDAQYGEVCRRGITKINCDTDIRLLWIRVFREYLRDHPQGIDIREPGNIFIQECIHLVQHHSRLYGCYGMIEELRVPLSAG